MLYDVMIRCPVTGKEIYAKMKTDRKSWETASYEGNSLPCSHCNQRHPWVKQDAWLKEVRKDHA